MLLFRGRKGESCGNSEKDGRRGTNREYRDTSEGGGEEERKRERVEKIKAEKRKRQRRGTKKGEEREDSGQRRSEKREEKERKKKREREKRERGFYVVENLSCMLYGAIQGKFEKESLCLMSSAVL